MAEHKLESGFPLYQGIGESCEELGSARDSTEYTTLLFKTMVRDTPFKQQDISELHQAVQEVMHVRYSESTVRRRMYDFRQDGSIILLDGEFSRQQDRVFQWTKTPGPPKFKLEPRSVFGQKKAGADPAANLFLRVMRKVFS